MGNNNTTIYKEGSKLFKNSSSAEEKRRALAQYIGPAIESLSSTTSGEEMFKIMRPYWSAFKALNIPQPKLRPNQNVKEIHLRKFEII